ncbi:ABC-F family ATP-binding cassette domain-containing protein [Pseudonocardia alni]|jgi:ATPase subunit of ABC transporter with duplicated ATPase domains|uniref:ATPase subunit of ABC transporter with duplicated ATPase domains n=1 Tax=Pseudonocardia alni TaxID=33907 RepID=A0A852W2S5_PSEA5|nr:MULTISPECIES: ABC-F family ATP-binding cassette domain-containing protein [Pseudonocardia]NWJ73517.1 ABC-F family ATP-binding cassette domain-containing protein [Pseudonocardia pini]OJG05613.1 ABC transporter ATP-binding protein uup [Pseudonocardia autotrophica]ALE79202.1 heme ABC transporter ATP-binding protein [Pseudonocardia sp. AL041005-10]MCO7193968.1 ATP-binding cassette domain-containing protein [Pseudonocardia sp. McavD-2-B]MYW76462.1 ATP-binding cassette domain-containing protein [
MSATLHVTGLAAGHGDRPLFSGLDLVVAPGDVIGLVGANGAGKSTLLTVLAGSRPPDDGSLTLAPPDATVGHLPQEPDRRPGETVAGFLARRTGVADAQATMDAEAEGLASGTPGADDRYAAALDRWLALGGADLDERSGEVLREVGLAVGPDAPMTGLSGGQAARANLAALLLSRYDLLLLDEPTNDLDLDGLERLERFVGGLARQGTPTVLVSHDREFLARTVNRIVELDLVQQRIDVYDGGYESYLAEREVARRHAREDYEEYADKLGGLKQRAVMQRNWMAQGVRNARRKTKDPDKNVRAQRQESSEKQAAKARQTERAIERLEVVEEPRKEWELRMEIASAPRSGSVVARADAAAVRRGDFAFGPATVQVGWADRVVVTGANGAGKSTLLGLLLGRIAPDSGSAGLGSGVLVGEIDQARGAFLGDATLLRAFGEQVPDWPESEVRTLLAKFSLGADQVLRTASSLSPGERTRAALALLQARGVNLLVLDEPTNHLDLPAIEQLEQAVEDFDGTVLLVTHDRRMLDTVRATRRWDVRDGTVTEL